MHPSSSNLFYLGTIVTRNCKFDKKKFILQLCAGQAGFNQQAAGRLVPGTDGSAMGTNDIFADAKADRKSVV